ncbi:TPA: gamma-glutamyl-gamma-aminobutyrate hydrolase family protein [Klebsiella oxytoca]|nr:gamma-glutamyl-gamma-aminobutyrate hydrolase family protein [Klebsiella oxytoca]
MKKPTIGILACARMIDDDSDLHHVVFRSYVDFITDTLDAVPVVIPSLFGKEHKDRIEGICELVDGLFLPGSPSNVSLRRTGTEDSAFVAKETTGQTDLPRDYTAMTVINHAVATDKPLLAVCRGIQELNVFFGGDLHKVLHQVPGRFDHRAKKSVSLYEKYTPAHTVFLTEDSLLKQLIDREEMEATCVEVNSLHSQGISVVGNNLCVECLAPDGTVEAVRHLTSSFIYGVQWHLEWQRSLLDRYISLEFLSHCKRRI